MVSFILFVVKYILLHSKAYQNVLMINTYGIFGVLVGEENACLGVDDVSSLQAFVCHGVSTDVLYRSLIVWIV